MRGSNSGSMHQSASSNNFLNSLLGGAGGGGTSDNNMYHQSQQQQQQHHMKLGNSTSLYDFAGIPSFTPQQQPFHHNTTSSSFNSVIGKPTPGPIGSGGAFNRTTFMPAASAPSVPSANTLSPTTLNKIKSYLGALSNPSAAAAAVQTPAPPIAPPQPPNPSTGGIFRNSFGLAATNPNFAASSTSNAAALSSLAAAMAGLQFNQQQQQQQQHHHLQQQQQQQQQHQASAAATSSTGSTAGTSTSAALLASMMAANTASAFSQLMPSSCNLNNTLFVGNLHASLQEIDLIQVFRPFGRIVECCKKWLHFGFVKFTTEEEACHAYITLNGFRLKGRPMRLEFQNRTKKARIKAIIAQAALAAAAAAGAGTGADPSGAGVLTNEMLESSLAQLGLSNIFSASSASAEQQQQQQHQHHHLIKSQHLASASSLSHLHLDDLSLLADSSTAATIGRPPSSTNLSDEDSTSSSSLSGSLYSSLSSLKSLACKAEPADLSEHLDLGAASSSALTGEMLETSLAQLGLTNLLSTATATLSSEPCSLKNSAGHSPASLSPPPSHHAHHLDDMSSDCCRSSSSFSNSDEDSSSSVGLYSSLSSLKSLTNLVVSTTATTTTTAAKAESTECSLAEHLEFSSPKQIVDAEDETADEKAVKKSSITIVLDHESSNSSSSSDSDLEQEDEVVGNGNGADNASDTSDDASVMPAGDSLDCDLVDEPPEICLGSSYDDNATICSIKKLLQCKNDSSKVAASSAASTAANNSGGIFQSVNETLSLFVEPHDVLRQLNNDEYREYTLFPTHLTTTHHYHQLEPQHQEPQTNEFVL